MPKKTRFVLVDEFVKNPDEIDEIKLVAGIDKAPKDPHHNAMFYIRMESRNREIQEPRDFCKTERIWLSLNELTRLSILSNIASQFWIETLEKNEPYSERRIKEFQEEYENIKSLEIILPKKR
jgi:hypothetical protein